MTQKLTTFFILTMSAISFVSYAGDPAPLDPVLTIIVNSSSPNPVSGAVGVRHAGDGSGRLFVIEQGGRIKIIENGNILPTPFLNISSLTTGSGERGLLGLAFHPNYSQNGFFYVYYTDNVGDSIVSRYTVSGADPNTADDQTELMIIRVDQDFSNHNGGDIHFSPADGFLYIGLGDGGSGNDPCNRGQTKSPDTMQNTGGSNNDPDACEPDANFDGNDNSRALLGAMLRIDVDNPGNNIGDACGDAGIAGGTPNYGIPLDNPFSDNDNDCGEIWAWGLRNPYRFGFDRDTGDLFIGDVGQSSREEFNVQTATSTGGENYGWVCREGSISTPGISCTAPNAVDPFAELSHSNTSACSAMGGFPYRGSENTWQGTYVYSDFCTQELYYSIQVNGLWSDVEFLANTAGNVRGFGEDEQGNLYYVTTNSVVQITDANYDDVIFEDGFE